MAEKPKTLQPRVPQELLQPLRSRYMKSVEFAIFFNDLVTLAVDEDRFEISPLEVLQKHNFGVELPPRIEEKLLPILRGTKGTVAASECGACGVCGVCAVCGEINVGAPGAAAAAIWAIA